MRSSLLVVALMLACGALGCSFHASALPIKVGLTGAAGSHSWTSGPIGDPSYLNLTAWQFGDGAWSSAFMDLGQDSQGNNGLGVCASEPIDNNSTCSVDGDSNQIDSVPWQVIDLSITGSTDWSNATLTLLSVDPGFDGSVFGATCAAGTAGCLPTQQALASCHNPNTSPMSCTFSFSDLALRGISDIWITPSASDPKGVSKGNMLLSVNFVLDTVPVPEPASWGMFGFGLLLAGAFVGLRRRRPAR